MNTERTELSFLESAHVIGVGLNLNLFERRDVALWADRHIAQMDSPPVWLLELATLRNQTAYDAGQVVLPYVPAVLPTITCGVILALMTPLEDVPDRTLRRFADAIYQLVRDICRNDWSNAVLREADQVHDDFSLMEDSQYSAGRTVNSMRAEMQSFFDAYSLPACASALSPIRCCLTV